MRERAVRRVQEGESPEVVARILVWDRHVQMTGAIPAWWLGRPESQAGSWTSAETRWPAIKAGLRHGDAEEPAAIEIRVCAMDARDGGEADQG